MLLDSIAGFLFARIQEISFLIASMLMLFTSDLIMGRVLLRRLKKSNFFTRTLVFVLYCLLALPAMTTGTAYLLRALLLTPLRKYIIVIIVLSFVVTGVILSLRYNMRMKLK